MGLLNPLCQGKKIQTNSIISLMPANKLNKPVSARQTKKTCLAGGAVFFHPFCFSWYLPCPHLYLFTNIVSELPSQGTRTICHQMEARNIIDAKVPKKEDMLVPSRVSRFVFLPPYKYPDPSKVASYFEGPTPATKTGSNPSIGGSNNP